MAFTNKAEMASFYGSFYGRSAGVAFVLDDVPPQYRSLGVYAEFWGEGDDGYREEMVADAPSDVRRDLAMAVLWQHLDISVNWLGGPHPDSSKLPEAYFAYSNLIAAAESAHFLEKKQGWDWKPQSRYTPPGSPIVS